MRELSTTVGCGSFDFTVGERTTNLARNGEILVRFGALKCGLVDESSALSEKFRTHFANDAGSARIELEKILPFGCEYRIRRSFDFGPSFCRTTVDVDPGAGSVPLLELEPVEFPGEWQKLTIFTVEGDRAAVRDVKLAAAPTDDPEVLYTSEAPLLALRLSRADGVEVEWGCGNQLWRYRSRELYPNSRTHCELVKSASGLTLKIRIADFAVPEEAPARRGWRLEHYLSFSDRQTAANVPATAPLAISLPELPAHSYNPENRPCLCSAPVRRALRDRLRKTQENAVVPDCAAGLCRDAGHLERPGKAELLHWDIEDFMELYAWGNKRLGAMQKHLTLQVVPEHWSSRLLALEILSRTPQKLTVTQGNTP